VAITVSTVSAGQLDAYNADKPILLSKNILAGITLDGTGGSGPEFGLSAVWRGGYVTTPTTPWPMDSDGRTDLAQCPLRAFDYNLAGLTSPWRAPSITIGLKPLAVLFCRTYATETADSVIIANHNFEELSRFVTTNWSGASLYVEVWMSTTQAFGAGTYEKLVRWEPGVTPGFSAFTKKRLVCLDLGEDGSSTAYATNAGFLGKYSSYTGGTCFQIVIGVKPVYTATDVYLPSPSLGEVFIGPRRQLSRNPGLDTWTDTQTISSEIGQFTSKSGVQTRYGISTGQSIYNPAWTTIGDAEYGTTDLYSLNDLATLDSFWTDTNYGANGFFLVPKPKTAHTTAPFCHVTDTNFQAEMEGGLTDRKIAFEFNETPPYVRTEV
jgi:hypothetical protein